MFANKQQGMYKMKKRDTADIKHIKALVYLLNANGDTKNGSVNPLNNNGAMLRIIAVCNAILNDKKTWVASDADTPYLVDVYNPEVLCFQVEKSHSLIINGVRFLPHDYSMNIKLPTGQIVNPSECLSNLLNRVKLKNEEQRE